MTIIEYEVQLYELDRHAIYFCQLSICGFSVYLGMETSSQHVYADFNYL